MQMINEVQYAPYMNDLAGRREKWAWLTEGIDERAKTNPLAKRNRIITEIMLENQEAQLRDLAHMYGLKYRCENGVIVEDTLSTAIGAFTTFAFPLVRRVYPKLLATELFIVQPMVQPTGKVFFVDFLYGQTNQGATAGNRIDVQANFASLYADSTEGGSVNDLNMSVSSVTVTAESKKLKSIWTIEAQQDLAAYHGLDLEGENMQMLADEVTREVDRKLINQCLAGATAGNTNFNISGSPSTLPTERFAYNEQLYEACVDANNLIFKKRYRNANWAIADTDTCGRLEKLQGFKLADLSDSQLQIQHGGRHLFGTLQNRWMIYKDPWFTANTILFGYKGQNFTDAGFIYAPYVPFWTTPLFIDPNDMKPRRGIMSRYAFSMVVGDMYSSLSLTTS